MATGKVYTWTPATPLGFLNDELENLWNHLGEGGSAYELEGPVYITNSTPLVFTATASNVTFRTQDGTSRFVVYWNTEGGGSPTFTNAGEAAQAVVLANPNSTGLFSVKHAPDDGHSAGGSLSWDEVFTVFKGGGFQHSLDLAATSDANLFYDGTAGRKQGSWNPWMDQSTPTGFRIVAKVKDDSNNVDSIIIGDPHRAKIFQGYHNASQTVSGASPVIVNWDGSWIKDDIYTHDGAGANPGRITVSDTGWYELTYYINLEETAGADRWLGQVNVKINGTTAHSHYTSYIRGAGGVDYGSAHWSHIIRLTASDYVEIEIDEVSTPSVTVVVPASPTSQVKLFYKESYRI